MAYSGNQFRLRVGAVSRRDRPQRLRLLSNLAALALVGFAASRIDAERLERWLPIAYLRVEGAVWNLDPDAFHAAVLPYTHGGYLLADLKGLETAAKQFAWVDSVRVMRVWPDTLVVRVEEQKPVARWGEQGLLNERGESFVPPDVSAYADLPQLSGPDGQEKQVLGMWHALNMKLQPRALEVTTLGLSKRRAWTAQLDNGVDIMFGHQDPLATLSRLLALLPQLGEERIAAIWKLDLRYPNGFSVVWKPPPVAVPEPTPEDSGA